MIGRTIAHYKILDRLGSGGMGEVWLAEDQRLKRRVALKFLPQSVGDDPEVRSRFLREAQAAAALSHPNIVTIYEVSEHEGRPFFSMELIAGKSLKQHCTDQRRSLEELLDLAIQIVAGLQRAHQAGITHRDLKPGNVLITGDGIAKIVDFGLAQLAGAARLTQTGSTLGTAAYMSPEQAQGRPLDQRSDLFSFGTLLYEMIAGRLPFPGEHDAAILYSIVHESPEPLTRFKSGIPAGLQALIDKLLQKNPEERYQSAADLLSDLRRLRRTGDSGPVAPAATRRKMLAVLPFENLGPAEDEYFADGITEEIISRLAAVSELGVISRTSAMQYKNSRKSMREIGAELGVDYILEGTVRWGRASGGPSRVRITPQLIQVREDTHLWSERYDRVLEDIFDVQTEIAQQVIKQLQITLLEPEKCCIEAQPTENMEAYQAYLRGLEYVRRPDYRTEDFRLETQMFQRAVELDPDFALAHAELGIAHTAMYFWGADRTAARLALAKTAIDRALALQPALPEAHIALGLFYYRGYHDYDRAMQEFTLAARDRPNDSQLLVNIAAVRRRQGRLEEALASFHKAMEFNPRDAGIPSEIGATCLVMRRYAASEQFLIRGLALAPDQTTARAWLTMLYWNWQGDLGKSRAALEASPIGETSTTRPQWFMQRFFERNHTDTLTWLSTLGADRIEDQVSYWPVTLLQGLLYDAQGDRDRAAAAFDAARIVLEGEFTKRPDDFRVVGSLGLAHAGMGNRVDAIRCADQTTALIPITKDLFFGGFCLLQSTRIRARLEDRETAIDQLEHLLSIPSMLSVSFLKIAPEWDPLRDHPRFQQLIAQPDKVF